MDIDNYIFPLVITFTIGPICLLLIRAFYQSIFYPLKQNRKFKNQHGYILTYHQSYEHREIVEKLINRKLRPGEEVHHINGKKWDNRKSNLALMTSSEHKRWHKKLEWMWSKKMFPSIQWQKRDLQNNFGATLF